MHAVAKGFHSLVRDLIQAGADVNARDEDTESVLMWAAAAGNTEAVELLLINGARVNDVSNLDGSALRWAVKNGHVATVTSLLAAGAAPNSAGVAYAAAYGGNLSICEKLLEAGTDFDVVDMDGLRPADWARRNAPLEVVELLSRRGEGKGIVG